MGIPIANMLTLLADASSASDSMRGFILPLVSKLIALAFVVAVFFVAYGGIQHITSSGDPEKLESAKHTIRNALIGLVIVIAAGVLTGILTQAYNQKVGPMAEHLPPIATVEPKPIPGPGGVIVDAIVGMFRHLIEGGASPVLDILSFFTKATPLMADNSGVFNLWLAMLGIANVLYILVLALLGFHVMSFASLGFKELDFKHLLPQAVIGFLLINTSIFAIDAVISLSNAMIAALNAAFPIASAWDHLGKVLGQSASLGLFALLIMIAFLVFALILLVYYVVRIVALYAGAVLSPLIFLLWVLPAFKDFAHTAIRVYLTTIFVLFVHVVILHLAGTLFDGMKIASLNQIPNALMSLVLGIATLWSLLKTQSVMSQLTYASQGASTGSMLARKLVHAVATVGTAAVTKGRGGGDGGGDKGGKGGQTTIINSQKQSRFYKSGSENVNQNGSSPHSLSGAKGGPDVGVTVKSSFGLPGKPSSVPKPTSTKGKAKEK
jgi:hypothetical protein